MGKTETYSQMERIRLVRHASHRIQCHSPLGNCPKPGENHKVTWEKSPGHSRHLSSSTPPPASFVPGIARHQGHKLASLGTKILFSEAAQCNHGCCICSLGNSAQQKLYLLTAYYPLLLKQHPTLVYLAGGQSWGTHSIELKISFNHLSPPTWLRRPYQLFVSNLPLFKVYGGGVGVEEGPWRTFEIFPHSTRIKEQTD